MAELKFIRSTPCRGMKHHRWCNHPGHQHCVVCDVPRDRPHTPKANKVWA